MLVAPTKGADSSQTRVQIVDVNPHSRLFSGETISVVHVMRMASSELMEIFDAMDVTINSTTRWNGVTK